MKKMICKTMNIIGCIALLVGTMAIRPASLIYSHQPNCPDELLK